MNPCIGSFGDDIYMYAAAAACGMEHALLSAHVPCSVYCWPASVAGGVG